MRLVPGKIVASNCVCYTTGGRLQSLRNLDILFQSVVRPAVSVGASSNPRRLLTPDGVGAFSVRRQLFSCGSANGSSRVLRCRRRHATPSFAFNRCRPHRSGPLTTRRPHTLFLSSHCRCPRRRKPHAEVAGPNRLPGSVRAWPRGQSALDAGSGRGSGSSSSTLDAASDVNRRTET